MVVSVVFAFFGFAMAADFTHYPLRPLVQA
jgi:hypothetical protein